MQEVLLILPFLQFTVAINSIILGYEQGNSLQNRYSDAKH
jgi:hypothetical protein